MFIVVAIVIFGIFVALSYTVFGSDGLSGGLSGIFEQSILKTEELVEHKGYLPLTEEHFVFETFTNTETGNTEVRIIDYTGNEHGVSSDITIPNELGGYPVTIIGNMAFRRKGLTSVDLPDTLRIIEDGYNNTSMEPVKVGAFMGNLIAEITFPESIEYVGVRAFYVNRLTRVNFPNSEFELGQTVFTNNRLTELELPSYITSIPRYTFYRNNLVEYTVQSHIKVIEERAFSNARLLEILTIPNSVVTLGAGIINQSHNVHTVNIPLHFEELISSDPRVLTKDLSTLEQPATINYIDENGNIVKTINN